MAAFFKLESLAVTLRTTRFNIQQGRQCTYYVTSRRVIVTTVAVEKQWELHIMSVCLQS